MSNNNSSEFPSAGFATRLRSMLRADARRAFTTPLFYICFLIALVMPVLILVMTTMASGTTMTDPTTGATTTMEAFTNTWQIIASESGAGMMSMDMTTMCNINLIYFIAGVYVCLFVAAEFRSGYAKNLFTVRVRKTDYVVSKTIIGFITGTLFLLAFFVGAVVGGSFAELPFDLGSAGVVGLFMCMLGKIFLMNVFVAIFLLTSTVGKGRAWMSILISLFAGMLLFMMIPMMTPLDSGAGNVFMCLAGGVIFAAGIGACSATVLKKTTLA